MFGFGKKRNNKAVIKGDNNTAIQVNGDNNVINANDNTPKLTSNTPDLGGVEVVGRGEIIKEIHEKFNNNHILVLYGQGGIGKTICSKYYANEHKNDYKLIRYMQFTSDIKTTLVAGCKLEEVGFDNFKFEEQFSAVKHYLEGLSEKTLLMIDINEGAPTDLGNLPQNSNIKILFTTRKKRLFSLEIAEEIKPGYLSEEDLYTIFINNVNVENPIKFDEEDNFYIKKIIKDVLRSNTMVIALTARTKANSDKNMKELYNILNEDRTGKELEEEISHGEEIDKYFFYYIKKLFDISELSQEEQEILRYMSIIDYDGVKNEKIKEWLNINNNYLNRLEKKGWLNFSDKDEEKIIFMHPVISDAVFEQTKPNSENCKKLLNGINEENVFYELYKKGYLTIICEFIIKRIGKEKTEAIANIYTILGNFYFALGEYDNALSNYQKSLYIIEKIYGNKSLNYCIINNYIGDVYYDKGEFNKSLEIVLKNLNIYEKYKYKDEIIIKIYRRIGGNYRCIGEYDKALEYYNKSLDMIEIFFKKECLDTERIYSCFGKLCEDTKQYDKSLEYYFTALNIFQKALSQEPHNIAWLQNCIGFVWYKKGDYDEALKYYQKSLDIKEKIFGEKHWYSVITYNNMGLCYYCKSEYNTALKYYFKCLRLNDIIEGKDYPDKKEICENIAACYEQINDKEKAEEYRQLAEEIEKKRQEHTEKECVMAGVN